MTQKQRGAHMEAERDPERELTPETVAKVTLIVWGFFTFTMCFLFCAALVLIDGSAVTPTPERDEFLKVFPIIGASVLLVSLVVFRLCRVAAMRRARQGAGGKPPLMRYFGAVVASCALNESVVVLGLVLTLITKNVADIIPYFGLAFGANALIFPTASKARSFFAA